MRPHKISLFELFYNQRRFVVPLYQRRYVWTKEAQWELLWDDITAKALAVRSGEAKAAHFLGAIVTAQRPVFAGALPCWDLIDGQQRLTTLQVLLAAFRDVTRLIGDKSFDVELGRITGNDGVVKEDVERFKVWPSNTDRPVFQDVMRAGSLDALVQKYPALRFRYKREPPRLAEAYFFFFTAIRRYLDGVDEEADPVWETRLVALFTTIRSFLEVVNIELEAGDDPQVIFESLNGRGVPLLPSDLVRNLIFMRANAKGSDSDALYSEFWRPYDEQRWGVSKDDGPWWKVEERQGRIFRPRINLFIFHYLQFKLQHEVNIGQLFQEFRNWWDRATPENPREALAEIRKYSKAFESWLEPEDSSRPAQFARWLKILDTSTVFPLLFFLLVETVDLERAERDGIIQDLESYLVRRAVCGLSNKQYNRFFLRLLTRLRTAGKLSRAGFRSLLSSGRGPTVRWPDDNEFGQAFLYRPLYQSLRREAVSALLLTLEQSLRTDDHEEIAFLGKLSIEHVLPQSWQKNWPLSQESEALAERRNRQLHTIGNLTLVTPKFNTKLSNREFSRKQKEFARIALLLLSRSIIDAKEWHEEAMVDRGRQLFDYARKQWPHPASPADVRAVTFEFVEPAGPEDDGDEPKESLISVHAAETLLDQLRTLLDQSVKSREESTNV